MLGNNQIGFNIWHLPSITFFLTCNSSTLISVDWALSWLLNKTNRIAWHKKEIKIKHSSVCLHLNRATLGVLTGNDTLHCEHELGANFAHDKGSICKAFALIRSHCRGQMILISSNERRGQGAENFKWPPPARGSVTWKFVKITHQVFSLGSYFSLSAWIFHNVKWREKWSWERHRALMS